MKELREAIMKTLKCSIDRSNYGVLSSAKVSHNIVMLMWENKIRIENDLVMQDGKPIYKVERRYATRKQDGMYKELIPNLVKVDETNKDNI